MSIGNTKADHERAKSISGIYNKLNTNTLLHRQQQTESDKKLKIWRFNVVKRDENAPNISKILKTTKSEKKKSHKITGEKKATPSKKVIEKKEKPEKVAKPKKPRKKFNPYKPVSDPESLKEDTIISRAWQLHISGKTIKEISEELNTPKVYISNYIYKRRKQLNLPDNPRNFRSNKGVLKEGTNTDKVWKLHEKGYTKEEISKELDIPLKNVAVFISNRRRILNIKLPENPITIAVHKLRDEGKNPTEIRKILNITSDTVRYHFYKKKTKQ